MTADLGLLRESMKGAQFKEVGYTPTNQALKLYPTFSISSARYSNHYSLFCHYVQVYENAYCMSTKCPGAELELASGKIYTAVMMGVNSRGRYMGLL